MSRSPTVKIDHVSEWLEMAKATGSILDDLDDSVEAFCDRVGHSGFDEGRMPAWWRGAVATNLRRGSRRLRKAEVVHRLKIAVPPTGR